MDRTRFLRLWTTLFDNQAAFDAQTVWVHIATHYAGEGRFYHNQDHIGFCLQQLDKISSRLGSPAEVEMALWFHDVIYRINSDSNEADSANFFCQLVGTSSDCLQRRDRIAELIMDTTHQNPPASQDGCYLADIDLSSLGRPWEAFLQDSRNVRRESPHLSDEDYNAAQRKFFQMLLSRPHLFHTQHFRDHLEQQARYNLTRVLSAS
ncbi:HD domain-containing protein [Aestuariirhabdus litorea]|uniref:N-methyl-D-aspartate receptor NMDAR2C subunit n=1 Tax=Aestuariirhabdus litorea TaxID=2528527 RepID=A0A3P3VPP7_9GAMM|nr:hypothetical protein [Aestuariirhabdus litorea]RRJ84742.1 hypothetical protein D0544_06485 [Aestuariirhabdus litorea]RWW97967.1 hypothetical protein DZC74_06480 [Endozoicomonadaceae bacterium GTF-13]